MHKEDIKNGIQLYTLFALVAFFFLFLYNFLDAWWSPQKAVIFEINGNGEAAIELIIMLIHAILVPITTYWTYKDLTRI